MMSDNWLISFVFRSFCTTWASNMRLIGLGTSLLYVELISETTKKFHHSVTSFQSKVPEYQTPPKYSFMLDRLWRRNGSLVLPALKVQRAWYIHVIFSAAPFLAHVAFVASCFPPPPLVKFSNVVVNIAWISSGNIHFSTESFMVDVNFVFS